MNNEGATTNSSNVDGSSGAGVECSSCPKEFKTKKQLDQHVKQVHDNSGPFGDGFRCPTCPKRLSTAKLLTRHLKNVHDKRDSLICGECRKPFQRFEDLDKHRKRMHPDAGRGPEYLATETTRERRRPKQRQQQQRQQQLDQQPQQPPPQQDQRQAKQPFTTAPAAGPVGDGDARARRMLSNPFMMAMNRSRPTPAAPAPAPAAAGINDDDDDDGGDDHFLTPLPKIPLPPPDPFLYPDSEAEKYPLFTTADAEMDGANDNNYKSAPCIGSIRKRAWLFIRTFRDERKFTKATYNFRMDGYSLKQINDAVIGTFQATKCQYKLNISLGYILYNAAEDRFRYHYPCMNNNGMFPLPMLVTCEDDVRKVISAIDALDPQDWVTTMRPTTAWSLRAITNVTLILFKCPPFPIG